MVLQHRPVAIKMWLGHGHPYDADKHPEIMDLGKYVGEWEAWWKEMQPDWRVGEDGSLVRKAVVNPDKWGGMRKPGPNSFFTVLLVLLWWRMESGDTCTWRVVVEEVFWCVKHMVGGGVRGPQVVGGGST